jgi:transcriptional regulator of acetoin/glycerol metabolism
MVPLPEDSRLVRRARAQFLASGDPATGDTTGQLAVRSVVEASWRRSLQFGVEPSSDRPPTFAEVNRDSKFVGVAAPVVRRALEELDGVGAGMLLSDADGRILRRWVDNAVSRHFDRAYAEPGLSLAEADVGTNAVGIVQETLRPALVRGHEHFCDRYLQFACAGVPIRHPVGGRLLGVLDVTVRDQAVPLMLLPWARALAREIELGMLRESSRDERLLLDGYVRHSHAVRQRPVLAVSDQTIISNPSAARLLDGADQTQLWEQAARTVHGNVTGSCTLTLRDGRSVRAVCRPVEDDGRVIGALLDLEPAPAARPGVVDPAPRTQPGTSLAGRSVPWRQAWAQATEGRDAGLPLLLRGEPGTGKRTTALALYDDRPAEVLDASLVRLDGFAPWGSRLRALLGRSDTALVLTHLEELTAEDARTVCTLLDGATTADSGSAAVVACLTSDADPAGAYSPLVERIAACAVDLPPLRERTADLPDLLERLTLDVTGRKRTWLSDAVQALSRLDWPGNVRQLRSVVMTVTSSVPAGDIGVRALPGDLLVASPRRRLSQIEQLEYNAIVTALRRSAGNKVEAAAALQMSRSTFYRRLRAFGLDLDRSTF